MFFYSLKVIEELKVHQGTSNVCIYPYKQLFQISIDTIYDVTYNINIDYLGGCDYHNQKGKAIRKN